MYPQKLHHKTRLFFWTITHTHTPWLSLSLLPSCRRRMLVLSSSPAGCECSELAKPVSEKEEICYPWQWIAITTQSCMRCGVDMQAHLHTQCNTDQRHLEPSASECHCPTLEKHWLKDEEFGLALLHQHWHSLYQFHSSPYNAIQYYD